MNRAVVVPLPRLSTVELAQLHRIRTETASGEHLRHQAFTELVRRKAIPRNPPGRWAPLVWFTATERILTPDELAAALQRHTCDTVRIIDLDVIT